MLVHAEVPNADRIADQRICAFAALRIFELATVSRCPGWRGLYFSIRMAEVIVVHGWVASLASPHERLPSHFRTLNALEVPTDWQIDDLSLAENVNKSLLF